MGRLAAQGFEFLARPLLHLFYFLSGLFTRDPRRWVFGSWSGRRFTDNGAALYSYVTSLNVPPIQFTWISSDRRIVSELRRQGLPACHRWSIRGMSECLRAGVFVFDGHTKDINHWLSRGSKRVLLRHGVGIKKIERGIDIPTHRLYKLFHGNHLQKAFWRFLLPWHSVRPDLVMATSPEHAAQAELYFGVDADKIAITGFARNDILFDDPPRGLESSLASWIEGQRSKGRKTFLFMPTFREGQRGRRPSWLELDRMAEQAGIGLLVKLHFVEAARDSLPENCSNLTMVDPLTDPNTLYSHVDGLISDFSSAAYDFMLLQKPLIFFIPDFDEFVQARTFYYDYNDVTPGPKTRTVSELADAVQAAAAFGIASYQGDYESILKRFHTFRDGGSAERTFAAIHDRFVATQTEMTEEKTTEGNTCISS